MGEERERERERIIEKERDNMCKRDDLCVVGFVCLMWFGEMGVPSRKLVWLLVEGGLSPSIFSSFLLIHW